LTTKEEKIEELTKKALEIAEEILMKACPRCGGASKNKGNSAGRCSSCLKKLATAKKTPGHWQRSQTQADGALRRQKGKNGTAPGTSKGNGTRKEIVDKMSRAEKKTGQKLSPDRIKNEKGYSSKNVRAIPEHLNRGVHNADTKKIAEWRKRLKKSNLTTEELAALIVAKILEETEDVEDK
jgi:hypothetical protein